LKSTINTDAGWRRPQPTDFGGLNLPDFGNQVVADEIHSRNRDVAGLGMGRMGCILPAGSSEAVKKLYHFFTFSLPKFGFERVKSDGFTRLGCPRLTYESKTLPKLYQIGSFFHRGKVFDFHLAVCRQTTHPQPLLGGELR
jgi:hypothetical protein